MLGRVFTVLVLLSGAVATVASISIITSLPGFSGPLPFLLETGYIGVGEEDEVQLFYYFIESERNPKQDPLMLWLTGGPGCSAFSGLVFEIGPLQFDYEKCIGNKPVFELNPYSWTKVASIIFLDAPVGTGFSYATNSEAYHVSDTISAAQSYEFLRKWLMEHPKFLSNPLYIGGDSYSGIAVPIIVTEISNGNEVGDEPPLNLQGYLLGDPYTDKEIDFNSRVKFAYLKALISYSIYQSFKRNCKGEYVNPDTNNTLCMEAIEAIDSCIGRLDTAQILEPACAFLSPKSTLSTKRDLSVLSHDSIELQLSSPRLPEPWCRNHHYLYSYIWANDKSVQEALHIRKGTIKDWVRCNDTLSYTKNISSSIAYHRNLTNKRYRALIYSGDQDMVVPYVGTLEWIRSLNLTIDYSWEPWFVDGQVAGYTEQYSHNTYVLTYATVKGGGHTAPEYKPRQCLAMVDRWFAYYHL